MKSFLSLGCVTVLVVGAGCSSSSADEPFSSTGSTTGSGTGTAATSGAGGAGGGATSTTTTSTGSNTTTTTTGASTTTGAGGAGGQGGATNGSTGSGGAGTGSGGGPPMVAEVFAHSASTLYKLDPITKAVTTVGAFSNIGGDAMIDIALDKNGIMFGTLFGGLVAINKFSAACTSIASGSYPNSLSFVPEGTVDPNEEALVGYQGSTYVRIDRVTGVITTIGSLGNNGYSSSGDIVSVINGGTYLTVNGNGCSDCIVEVNPTTGAFVSMIGALNHSSVYGVAYWAGVAYGFDSGGQLFSIDLTNAATTSIPMPNPPPGLSFYGAGSSTSAPHM